MVRKFSCSELIKLLLMEIKKILKRALELGLLFECEINNN